MLIKKFREKAGITQMELAKKIGVNQTAISQWERGSTLPSASKLPLLASILSCTVDDLLRKEDE